MVVIHLVYVYARNHPLIIHVYICYSHRAEHAVAAEMCWQQKINLEQTLPARSAQQRECAARIRVCMMHANGCI